MDPENQQPLATEASTESSLGNESGSESESKPKSSKKRTKGSQLAFDLSMAVSPIALVAVITSVLGLMGLIITGGSFGWICEVAASLKAQTVTLLLFTTLPALFSKPWRVMSYVTAGLAFLNIAIMAPNFDGNKVSKAESSYLSFNVLEILVDTPTVKVDEAAKLALDIKPEVCVMVDLDLAKMARLNPKLHYYHYRSLFPSDDGHGVCFYAQAPLKGGKVVKLGPDKIPVAMTTAFFEFGWVNLVGFKAPFPDDEKGLEKRNKFLEAVSKAVSGLTGPTIVVGNMNMTPYSSVYGKFLSTGKLKALRNQFSVKPNYYVGPNDLILNRIPIDNIFVNDKVSFVEKSVITNDYNGKHLPLMGKFSVNSKDEKYTPQTFAKVEAGGAKKKDKKK